MKEEFRDIYENCQSVESGKHRMSQWLIHAQVFMEKLLALFGHIYQKFLIILLATQLALLWKELTIKLS
ncbi:hypothetical protein MiSe_24860 [Microseira wollei NIES-4236]|uniref:Transposase n=1 Tax=Microseira wollei NIES-4236 TaxID=2530354 RepID=A0AAV3XBT1_9CYAN|nr:hypothetical protein MiSe_24860 [Microseira wollei NIES-4236]